jgi:mycothiol synthase
VTEVTWRVQGNGPDGPREAVGVLDPDTNADAVGAALGARWDDLARQAFAAGATSVEAVVDEPADQPDRTIDLAVQHAAFTDGHRELLQLRRPLPVPADHPSRAGAPPAPVRPFVPSPGDEAGDDDEAAWVEVNNRAFAHHPSQGRETIDSLHAQMREDWFDPNGFLVLDDAERPGHLAGSCWTKIHPARAEDPALGEIYVIGVDPRHEGHGLGRTLVLAGLDHLAAAGPAVGMLYVEADNAPALALYDRLDFSAHHRRRLHIRLAPR